MNHRLQCENAASLTYFGEHGLLAAILTDVQYVAFTGAAFVPIDDPGPIFPPPPANATPQQAATLLEAYKTNKYCHTYWIHAVRALKRQWETCVERPYMAALRNPMVGLANTTPLQIITHLYGTYGDIDEVDLETNKTNMMRPYSPDQPIATLVEQLERGRFFAATGY